MITCQTVTNFSQCFEICQFVTFESKFMSDLFSRKDYCIAFPSVSVNAQEGYNSEVPCFFHAATGVFDLSPLANCIVFFDLSAPEW